MAKQRGTVDLYLSTRELLKLIIAMPGNGRSQPVMIDILVRAEAARVGLIEGPKLEGKCPECGDDLQVDLVGGTKHCVNLVCDYRC